MTLANSSEAERDTDRNHTRRALVDVVIFVFNVDSGVVREVFTPGFKQNVHKFNIQEGLTHHCRT
jgi:hypothetical protein